MIILGFIENNLRLIRIKGSGFCIRFCSLKDVVLLTVQSMELYCQLREFTWMNKTQMFELNVFTDQINGEEK